MRSGVGRRFLVRMFALLCASVFSLPGCGEPGDGMSSSVDSGAVDESPRGFVQRIRAMADDAASDGFSGSILVTLEGERTLLSGYGLANRDLELPNTERTAFDFGSVMKDLTAAAIFKLEERGQLARGDALRTIYSDIPTDKAVITLQQLLQHRAGLREFHDRDGDFEPMTRTEARQRIFDQDLLFAPGAGEAYSNSGFSLLADIVQTVSGRPFTEYVREELLAAAMMEQSGFVGDSLWQPGDIAIGYDAERFGDNNPATWPYTWALIGNGGFVTTVVDMEKWLVSMRSGDILAASARNAYVDDYQSPLSLQEDGAPEAFFYAGAGDFGLGGTAIDIPERNSRVIIGSNAHGAFDIEKLAEEIGQALLVELSR